MVNRQQSVQRPIHVSVDSRLANPDGCVNDRLGHQFQGPGLERNLDRRAAAATHQRVGNADCAHRMSNIDGAVAPQMCTVSCRQSDSGVVSAETGGTRSQLLMFLTRQVLGLAETESFIIQARHIKGALNVVADLASRRGYVVNTEWMLAPAMFQWVQRQSPWGPALIDLFANSMNH